MDQQAPTNVYKLKKTLYGLKQTYRVWNFKQAVQVRHLRLLLDWRLEGTDIRIEPVYVDDLRIFSISERTDEILKKQMTKKFVMRDLGNTKISESV